MFNLENPFQSIDHRRWQKQKPPRKILVIRLQALGDTVITLPYLQSLKRQHPELQIHFLTRQEVAAIPIATQIFDRVFVLHGGRDARKQFAFAVLLLPQLLWGGYEVVIDLQNNKISRFIRKFLKPQAWSAFDTQSPVSAGLRTKLTIESIGVWNVYLDKSVRVHHSVNDLLMNNGWNRERQLVVLNPAGSLPSRSWSTENYIGFAQEWLAQYPDTQFVLLLLPAMKEKAQQIATALRTACVDLTGKANQLEAFAVLEKCSFILSEDSGLMHMAWIQGVPTLALFSSSRKDWSAPQGDWSACLDSSDMACGPCELVHCQFGDNRCLNRYSPQLIYKTARAIVEREVISQ